MFEKRWNNLDFHEENGESIKEVQKRNIQALSELLINHENKRVIIGHHGTALASVLNYYDSTFGLKEFYGIINLMPYIVRMVFDNNRLIIKEDMLCIQKEHK